MNAGQMLEDVRLAAEGRCPIEFYGRLGGIVPLPDEILPELEKLDAEVAGEEEGQHGNR
jgi:2-oxoglutarate ferredoxin oxidoreductase subunit alpha